ncbi:MAG: TolB family protein [Candidatus Binatia bacterium]
MVLPCVAFAKTNRYFNAQFSVQTNAATFGQDPSWTHDGRVLSSQNDDTGTQQVYVSNLDGSNMTCLTCGQPGPNGFPQEQPPKGDWVLFCSWRGETVTFGKPCLGGLGSDLYVMHPDGSQVTRLTSVDGGADPQDNYHPYWSPDGKQLVWTHVTYQFPEAGGTLWEIDVADFVQDQSGPHLANITVVGPAGNAGYETQVWAPDGSGFLFTQVGGKDLSGWMNAELYFMRVKGQGASEANPLITQLTDGSPAWDEQAVFTPDMNNVIWMSSRDHPTWYQTVVSAAQWLGFDAPQANTLFGPMFIYTILDPRFETELYEMDLHSHAIRRLTFDNNVIPEFYFDHTGKRLLWTETASAGGPTRVGTFNLNKSVEVTPTTFATRTAAAVPATVEPAASTPHITIPASLPPQLIAEVPLLTAALTSLSNQLQGLSQGGTCCMLPGP